MKLIPNFITNADSIVEECRNLSHAFKPRQMDDAHYGFIPNIPSRFCTLKNEDMPDSLFSKIFSSANQWDSDVINFWSFIQIQRYDIGDYIVPHRDAYFVKKLHLVTLTSSDKDGLICEDDDHILKFIPDKAGQYIDFRYDAVHFVSPVIDHPRYSIVVGM